MQVCLLQNICDEFVCALRKRVLLQGRLYICEHFICFHSNLFGYSKDKVIPLKVVADLLCCDTKDSMLLGASHGHAALRQYCSSLTSCSP